MMHKGVSEKLTFTEGTFCSRWPEKLVFYLFFGGAGPGLGLLCCMVAHFGM